MDNTWHRMNITVLDRSQRQGTVSLFFDYNLASWLFGVRVDRDPFWITTYIELGPFTLDVTYWRRTPTVME